MPETMTLPDLLRDWLAEAGEDDPDLAQQMRDLDAARHSTRALWVTPEERETTCTPPSP
jgi:hypothetical protein